MHRVHRVHKIYNHSLKWNILVIIHMPDDSLCNRYSLHDFNADQINFINIPVFVIFCAYVGVDNVVLTFSDTYCSVSVTISV